MSFCKCCLSMFCCSMLMLQHLFHSICLSVLCFNLYLSLMSDGGWCLLLVGCAGMDEWVKVWEVDLMVLLLIKLGVVLEGWRMMWFLMCFRELLWSGRDACCVDACWLSYTCAGVFLMFSVAFGVCWFSFVVEKGGGAMVGYT